MCWPCMASVVSRAAVYSLAPRALGRKGSGQCRAVDRQRSIHLSALRCYMIQLPRWANGSGDVTDGVHGKGVSHSFRRGKEFLI